MSLQVVRGTDGQHHFVGGIAEQRERAGKDTRATFASECRSS